MTNPKRSEGDEKTSWQKAVDEELDEFREIDIDNHQTMNRMIERVDRISKQKTLETLETWVKKNALSQTTFSNVCWDDGIILFKKTDTKAQGDWSQEQWDKKIRDFQPMFLNVDELLTEITKLKEGK